MFYRPGGSAKAINRQQDTVYTDAIGGATDWLPINQGDTIAVNINRASLTFQSNAQSSIAASPFAGEYSVLLEMGFSSNPGASARPIDQWQNLTVATQRRAHRAGWVRLRVLNINNSDGTGVVMDMQVSRTGSDGATG